MENYVKILALHASAHAAMNEILEELYLSAAKLGQSWGYQQTMEGGQETNTPPEVACKEISTDTIPLHQTPASPK